MSIMRKTATNIRSAAKEASHERIVQAAARAIRRSGYDGTGVADIMKEAGLTHGAFYAHFQSREAMLAEAADRAGAESNAYAAQVIACAPPAQALQALTLAYCVLPCVLKLGAAALLWTLWLRQPGAGETR